MPQERENQFVFPTAEDVAEAPGSPAQKAARNVLVRHITGMPRKGYLLGDCDHAPIYRGVTDLTEACYRLIAAVDRHNNLPDDIIDRNADLAFILEHHGCPTRAEAEAERAATAVPEDERQIGQ